MTNPREKESSGEGRALQLPLRRLLTLAAQARRRMREGASFASALDAEAADLPPNARAALQSILYDLLRSKALVEALARRLLESPPPGPVLGLIEAALALLVARRYSDFTLVSEAVNAARAGRRTARFAGLVNAVLRRFLREREPLLALCRRTPEVRFNAPAWWIERVRAAHPDEWESILSIVAHHAPMTLRVNVRRTTPEAYLERLAAAGIAARRVGPEAVLLEKPLPVQEIPGFTEGDVSVQDAGTQLAAHLLPVAPGDRVLDACAAPGGKTAHILERTDCRVTALEVDPERAELIRSTLSRLGLSAEVRAADAARTEEWWTGEPFDAVLLDAPCTASGIVRRQPDVPWSRRPEDIRRLAAEQKRLLDALWPCLRRGGKLLFCTCSIFPEEGPRQIEGFLARRPDARLVPLRADGAGMMGLIPTESGDWSPSDELPAVHDGFFYALLEKR